MSDSTKPTITRQEFVDAIEAGITEADLTPAEVAVLRVVGTTAPNTARGTFQQEGYTCPLCTAGISRGEEEENREAIYRFYSAFDDSTGAALRSRGWPSTEARVEIA